MAKRVPESEAASEAEIVAAIQALPDAELTKLKLYARYRVYSVGQGVARGRTWGDLLGDAMVATLNGDRSWRIGTVSFSAHLIASMRSIADHWRDEKETPDSTFAGETADGDPPTPLARAHAPHIDLDGRMGAAATLKTIEDLLQQDATAMEIYSGLRAELSRADMCEILDLTEQEYDTRMRRIRRRIAHLREQGTA